MIPPGVRFFPCWCFLLLLGFISADYSVPFPAFKLDDSCSACCWAPLNFEDSTSSYRNRSRVGCFADREEIQDLIRRDNRQEQAHDLEQPIPYQDIVMVFDQVPDELIVRFSSYRYASEHRDALQKSLQGGGWHWIDRVNPASAFPTDFGLLKIERWARVAVEQQLRRLEYVKDLSPQSHIHRAPLMESESDAASSDVGRGHGGGDQHPSESSLRQGKWFTQWTALGQNVSHVGGGRKLFLQVEVSDVGSLMTRRKSPFFLLIDWWNSVTLLIGSDK